MKLAEALQERADLNRKVEQLKARLSAYALVQKKAALLICQQLKILSF